MTPETRARIERAAAKIAKAHTAVAERNAAIIAAHLEGASLREIAAVARINHMAVRKIITKENSS